MATVTAKWYGNALKCALNKEINWSTDSIKVMLCTASYVPDQDAHIYKSSVTNEVTGATGYTAGGADLTGKTINYTNDNVITLDAADVSWANSTITARYAVIYDDTPASNKPLLGYIDFGADMISSNGAFTIAWAAAGIFTITAS